MDLLVNTYGTRIRSSGERIVLFLPDKTKKQYAIRRLDKIIILRPSSISTHAVQLALEHDVDIVYLGSFGKPLGRIFPSSPRGLTKLRRAQLDAANSGKAFELAKTFVVGKVKNQIAYLQYLQKHLEISFSKQIIASQTMLDSVGLIPNTKEGVSQLLGVEGFIADKYFSGLKRLYKFPGRNPRGRDKFNSALNYGYGILYSEVERACLYVGLDPYLGFYHTERYGKPALVLDLVEELRVPIIDSVIFSLFLNKKFAKSLHFEKVGKGSYQLSSEGKHQLVEAVYKRLNQKVKWDGKTIAVKDVIVYQVRKLAHLFIGKEFSYKPFDFKTVVKNEKI